MIVKVSVFSFVLSKLCKVKNLDSCVQITLFEQTKLNVEAHIEFFTIHGQSKLHRMVNSCKSK